MPYDKNGRWYQMLFKKQADVVNSTKKFMLVDGPRYSGKTTGCGQAVVNHARITPRAYISVIGSTAKVNANSGSWQDLMRDGGIIDQYVVDGKLEWNIKRGEQCRNKLDNLTKSLYSEVRGPYGVSRFELDSLNVETEVADKFKGRSFSMIWVTQMEEVFRNRHSFDIVRLCLRGLGLKPNQFRFLADANPPDEGKESWIYKHFYEFPATPIPETATELERQALQEEKNQIETVTIYLEDNIFISPEQRREIYAAHSHDPNLLERLYYGRYVRATGLGYFADVWRPQFHVVGSVGSRDGDDYLVPEEECWELITGWDPGDRNPAVVFMEAVDVSSDPNWPIYSFRVLDELVIQKQDVPLESFVELVIDKMDRLEKIVNDRRKEAGKEPVKIKWTHYSDSAAFSRYDSLADTYIHKAVFLYSGERIVLRECEKAPNTIKGHMNLIRKLLFQNRIIIDAHCEYIQRMFSNFKLTSAGRIPMQDEDKHVMDALRYAIASMCYHEIESKLYKKRSSSDEIIAIKL